MTRSEIKTCLYHCYINVDTAGEFLFGAPDDTDIEGNRNLDPRLTGIRDDINNLINKIMEVMQDLDSEPLPSKTTLRSVK